MAALHSPTRRRFLSTAAGAMAAASVVRPDAQQSSTSAGASYDFIVVGGGSTGCVVASRLSERPGHRVLLLEAGGAHIDDAVRRPGQWTSLLGGRFDWHYSTEPEPSLMDRRIAWPRGKGLGGSSLINAMSYVRGHRLDYDRWSALGNAGWDFASVLPLFLKSEHNERGASTYHAVGGPLHVADTRDPHGAHTAFLNAARQRGLQADPDWDFNGAVQEGGAGFYQKSIKQGARQSAADAFLEPARDRGNLVIASEARVRRVLVEQRHVTGVEYVQDGRTVRVRAEREVVLCAGTLESPKLLMLSGLGPADALRRVDIPVVADLPGVGQNLHDHPRVTVPNRASRELPPSSVSGGLFLRSERAPATGPPDLHFYFGRGLDAPSPVLALTVALGQPQSRGRLTLASTDPFAAPRIECRYLHEAADVAAMIAGVRWIRSLIQAEAFSSWFVEELDPGPSARTDAELEAFVRKTSDTMFHPVGTCRMGTDAMAVVDAELRVRGVERLRIADASIMPHVVNAPTHAACLMIGERAAALMLAAG